MPVEVLAGAVVAHGGSGVCVSGGDLDVTQVRLGIDAGLPTVAGEIRGDCPHQRIGRSIEEDREQDGLKTGHTGCCAHTDRNARGSIFELAAANPDVWKGSPRRILTSFGVDLPGAIWAQGERFDWSAAVGVEEGDGGLDAPVDAWVGGQVEAAEDGGDVGFDGSFRDSDAVGDGLVGVAFGDQGQHAAPRTRRPS